MDEDIVREHLLRRDTDTPLVVEIPRGDWSASRAIAELYRLRAGGLVFLDIGWAAPDNPGHPVHLLAEPHWDSNRAEWVVPQDAVEEFAIRPLVRGRDAGAERDWTAWCRLRTALGGTRERGRQVAEETFGRTTGN